MLSTRKNGGIYCLDCLVCSHIFGLQQFNNARIALIIHCLCLFLKKGVPRTPFERGALKGS